MGDGEDAGAGGFGPGADDADECGGGGGVEHGGHLVAEQVAGVDGEGAGEAGPLELAFADLVRPAVEELAGQADAGGEVVDVGGVGRSCFGDGAAQE